MTGVNDRCFRVPYGVAAAVGAWCVVAALTGWTMFTGSILAGLWAVVASDVAAVLTAVVAASRVVQRLAEIATRHIIASIDERRERWVAEVAEEVLRLLDVRDLEAQVARLTPPRQRS